MKRSDKAEDVFKRLAAEQARTMADALNAAAALARPQTRRALGISSPELE